MALVYAAVVPHAPVLAPTLAADHHAVVHSTISSLQHIGRELRLAQVETMIVLTPHFLGDETSFFVNTAEKLRCDLSKFGDYKTNTELPGAWVFAQHLRAAADQEHVPMRLQSTPDLDYGVSVPWLAGDWPNVACLPIATYGQSDELLFRFGELLGDVCHQQQTRCAIIASADLAERPAGKKDYRPLPWERDVATALREGRRDHFPPPTTADPCGRAPIVALMSAVASMQPSSTILSFESPFRVGYLTAECHLRR